MSDVPSRVGIAWLAWERKALLAFEALVRKLKPPPIRPRHLLVGERGELEALFFLRRLGYVVVERRWRAPEWNGDLDLVAWEGETLVVVEVKTRSRRTITPAEASVDRHKRKLLQGTARAYRRTLPQPVEGRIPMRFDIVSVYLAGGLDDPAPPECELLRDVLVVDEREAYFGE